MHFYFCNYMPLRTRKERILTLGIAYTKDPRQLKDPEADGLVLVRNERVDFSSRVVWMWRVMCGERRRGRDIWLGAVNWVVLLIFGEVFNKVMLTCTDSFDASSIGRV